MSKRTRRFRWAPCLALAGVAWLLPLGPAAAPTDPKMLLTLGDLHGDWVGIRGTFPARGVVEAPLAIQLLVRDLVTGTRFVRYELGGLAFEGDEPLLADGLDASEASALGGTPAPGASLLFLGPARVEVQLPAGFAAGAVELQMFFEDVDGVLLSNAVTAGGAP